jgi:hypothetical protein
MLSCAVLRKTRFMSASYSSKETQIGQPAATKKEHMKTLWVKVLILVCATLWVRGNPPSLIETMRLALSLDELVDQQPSRSDAVIRNGRPLKSEVPPVPLSLLTPVASDILKIDESQLRKLLQDNREKLSRIVYARILSDKNNVNWTEALKSLDKENELNALQNAGIPLSEIHEKLDHLYTELAFAALDAPLENPKPKRGKISSADH